LTKSASRQLPAPDLSTLRNVPVLVVDNNATNLRLVKEALLRWNMIPTLVDAGAAALAALQQAQASGEPFPLMLTDVQMPAMDGFTLVERIKQNPDLAATTIILLTSTGQRGDGARCRELGVAGYLTKPIKQSELRGAILSALGGKHETTYRPALVIRHSLRESRRKLRILVAEDNPVNQTLIVRLLQKRGHSAVVANNGREVLATLEKSAFSGFDLALMDVQMPSMDGLEATAAIRQQEKVSGKHLPIIALTAHAMQGDKDRCFAAGADGYLSKPIHHTDLFAAIESLVPAEALSHPPGPPEVTHAPAKTFIFDYAAILGAFDGDIELMAEIAGVFLKNCPQLLAEVRAAIAEGDSRALNRSAHSLKGSISNFAVPDAYQAALRLETMGRDGDLSQAEDAFRSLAAEIDSLVPFLESIAHGVPQARH